MVPARRRITKPSTLKMKCRASVQTLQCNVKNQTNVLHLCTSEIFQNGNQIKKLIIMGVREPAADGYRVLRVEYI